jgi:hypothetical protein
MTATASPASAAPSPAKNFGALRLPKQSNASIPHVRAGTTNKARATPPRSTKKARRNIARRAKPSLPWWSQCPTTRSLLASGDPTSAYCDLRGLGGFAFAARGLQTAPVGRSPRVHV